ncbi:1,6-dihydroxycyclohexa-2,4-diene-1-carboxylate dehydrogenase [Corynebacterium tapiri]|uniref:1,6-dihydroxycyclohexa-2,4-diene-1-carboxylate dehydrogenase n=1 Tax=Corynebacterium tapiri TaxID=1448266 RepID=A0A5C4U3K9_9CORY|nr:1,6-dihydroxycyclohexa-2,4-diene-1-carboxylate dehydrogenase [Corynebacterium tapiri]TNL96685.1 1,6-dihydroxycyclohexa-2,4-diene-1-carboxylate dehydrogenase [Corynebacterium tapiri]
MPEGGGIDLSQEPAIYSPQRFAGQRVLITGAAQGIGLAVAHRIAYEDGSVFLVDRAELVHDVAKHLAEAGKGTIGSATADLEAFEGATAMMDAAIEALGGIDVAINVVGGTIWAKPFEEYAPEEIEKEVTRSLMTTLWSVRAELPHLINGGGGTIVNVSSVATRGINRVPYAASKGGVNALTAALALEAADKNVRVVATAPGGTLAPERAVKRGPGPESEQEKAWYQQIVDQTIDSSLFKRYGTLQEQAGPIAFLASREASYVTGSVLPVAGGDQG